MNRNHFFVNYAITNIFYVFTYLKLAMVLILKIILFSVDTGKISKTLNSVITKL